MKFIKVGDFNVRVDLIEAFTDVEQTERQPAPGNREIVRVVSRGLVVITTNGRHYNDPHVTEKAFVKRLSKAFTDLADT